MTRRQFNDRLTKAVFALREVIQPTDDEWRRHGFPEREEFNAQVDSNHPHLSKDLH